MEIIPGLKLYMDSARAPNPRRVSVFLAEKNAAIETEKIDIGKLEHKSEDFTLLNPMQRLPVLVLEDGTVIGESVAICRYVEAIRPEPNLMGDSARQSALIEMWQRRVEFGLLMQVAWSFRHLHPGAAILESPQIAEWGEASKPRAVEFMQFLDSELAGRKHVAGEEFSIADVTAIIACQFCKPARIEIPGNLENLHRWREEVEARPSLSA